MNFLQRFLIICSGSNLSVLKKTPSEWNKHAGMGGIIFFTALFATISASYALFTVFDSLFIAISFGFIWGLMIFNLDRYIVSSMRNYGNPARLFFTALPRLILAFVLGIVISKPLELKIFEKEIDRQLNVIINRNKLQLQDSLEIRFSAQTLPYKSQKDSLSSQLQKLKNEYAFAELELEKEIIGTGSETTSGKAGFGTNAKRKAEIKEEKKKALEMFIGENKAKLDTLENKVKTIYNNLQKELQETNKTENRYNGFLARLQALEELSTQSAIMALASLFIMGIFVILEMSPVLVKLISPKGPYDEAMKKIDFFHQSYTNEFIKKEEIKSSRRIDQL